LGRITSVDHLPIVNIREYDVELYTNPRLVRYVASGMCGIHASALTYVSERFYIEFG